jgi:uncharacterized protein YecT (DUF1311 family)
MQSKLKCIYRYIDDEITGAKQDSGKINNLTGKRTAIAISQQKWVALRDANTEYYEIDAQTKTRAGMNKSAIIDAKNRIDKLDEIFRDLSGEKGTAPCK